MRTWRRIAVAIGALTLCEIAARIVAPDINAQVLGDYLRQNAGTGLLWLYNLMAGGALARGTVLALGIMPYLSARIFMRLAGARNRRWTRVLTLGISVIQAAGFARFVQLIPGAVSQPGLGFTVRTITVMTMGSLLLMWLGERAVAGVEDDAAVSAALAAEQEPA